MNEPQFFMIAGPNGAGKSTSGHLYVPPSVPVFNGDLVLAELARKYPDIPSERLQGGVAKALEDAREAALAARKDFAFESNYSSDMATEITVLFREAGYRTTLVYFGLDSLEESAARVMNRLFSGGHDVPAKVIQYNFTEGLQRMRTDLHLFDTKLFIDTQHANARIIALAKGKEHAVTIVENINWYNKHFKALVELPALKRRKKGREIPPEPDKGLSL